MRAKDRAGPGEQVVSGFHLRVILQLIIVFIGGALGEPPLKGPSTLSIPGTLLKMGDVLWSSIPHTCW